MDDILLAFLPLAGATLRAHEAGQVAPLEGFDQLRYESGQMEFAETDRLAVRNAAQLVDQIQRAADSGLEVLSEFQLTAQVDGCGKCIDLSIGQRGEEIKRPVFLPDYVGWEHEVGHHDPLTDIFSLGMILASLALGLDFTRPEDLLKFVQHRRNLFALRSDLHPVLARAILRMTELDRRHRVQDLAAVIANLENYREQEVDMEFDLSRFDNFNTQNRTDKSGWILDRLRHRLYNTSKRNRLLHFKPTLQTVNLTHSSIPISLNVQRVCNAKILVWNADFHKLVVRSAERDTPILLNKYLNFQEALYLPSTLDRIIAEVRRDETELGFAQLRIVACFLHWADLKQKPAQHYDSPLILIPVALKKKKGIQDTYQIEVQTTDAEINPTLRHLFKNLYNIELPESIDLTEKTAINDFFDFLQARVKASEPAVTLSKLDAPQFEVIHVKAKRRLDQYTKRARIADHVVQSGDPMTTDSIEAQAPVEQNPVPVVEVEKSFFSVPSPSEENPYQWNFDLCGVSLGNFRYHKMSLVRDYDSLLGEMSENPAFEATFSLAPKEVSEKTEPLPLHERFDVVSCDPTQAESIACARTGRSYIIQGPPGTGKSQTIVNLIADYVAQGKRVLFVCEKRAAIDVVFARLRQIGLADLCCLIHDSRADKKAFVMNLKETYESVLAESGKNTDDAPRQRALRSLSKEIAPLDAFDCLMQRNILNHFTVRNMLERSIELMPVRPELSALESERLSDYSTWLSHTDRLGNLAERVAELRSGQNGIFSSHPLRYLSVHLAEIARPVEAATAAINAARNSLTELLDRMGKGGIPREHWDSIEKTRLLLEYAQKISQTAESGHLSLLDPKSERSKVFVRKIKEIAKLESLYRDVAYQNTGWIEGKKLSAEETRIALEQARQFEKSVFSWLNPARWRLRSIMNKSYNFDTHRIQPSWSTILTSLDAEHQAWDRHEKAIKKICDDFVIRTDVHEFSKSLRATISSLTDLSPSVAWVHAALIKSDTEKSNKIVQKILSAQNASDTFQKETSGILDLQASLSLSDWDKEISGMKDALTDLPRMVECLAEMKYLPAELCTLIRSVPWDLVQLESAIATNSALKYIQDDKCVRNFGSQQRDRQAEKIERIYVDWLSSNAKEIRRRIHRHFLENVRHANSGVNDTSINPKDPRSHRAWKKQYNQGRRALEHEFGKMMRYRSIRDLVSGETGEVVRDLKLVWLMSPLSVSDTLPLDTDCFDVVIFDEASQITLEEAIPPLFRAKQAIVVGDEKQLPPTDFFASKKSDIEDSDGNGNLVLDDSGEATRYDLESNSFLNHAAKNLSSTMLGWHYRSRSESLISYSNAAFYEGKLLTVPDVRLPVSTELGAGPAAESPIKYVYLPDGVYDSRRNHAEALKIVELTRELMDSGDNPTIGIIAFSEAQQDEIETALEERAYRDQQFAEQLEIQRNREEDGQFVGLLVKNLENIQGDERDAIILSVCYGNNPLGKMRMNFGPINKSGGERRLNVSFSRAKRKMIVVSSIRPDAITNDYNQGAACLKNYLRYAEAISSGREQLVKSILHTASGHLGFDRSMETGRAGPMAEQLCEALEQKGLIVDKNVGHSEFRCDLAIRRKGDITYRLGILLDNENYYRQTAAAESPEQRVGLLLGREMMRPQLLRDFDWNIAVVLAKDWFESPESVLENLQQRMI